MLHVWVLVQLSSTLVSRVNKNIILRGVLVSVAGSTMKMFNETYPARKCLGLDVTSARHGTTKNVLKIRFVGKHWRNLSNKLNIFSNFTWNFATNIFFWNYSWNFRKKHSFKFKVKFYEELVWNFRWTFMKTIFWNFSWNFMKNIFFLKFQLKVYQKHFLKFWLKFYEKHFLKFQLKVYENHFLKFQLKFYEKHFLKFQSKFYFWNVSLYFIKKTLFAKFHIKFYEKTFF